MENPIFLYYLYISSKNKKKEKKGVAIDLGRPFLYQFFSSRTSVGKS